METGMITTSAFIAIITIWVLTLAGVFFGGRAAWRRKRRDRAAGKRNPAE
jgi:hypothetical protein